MQARAQGVCVECVHFPASHLSFLAPYSSSLNSLLITPKHNHTPTLLNPADGTLLFAAAFQALKGLPSEKLIRLGLCGEDSPDEKSGRPKKPVDRCDLGFGV